MTFSPLASRAVPSHGKYSSREGRSVDYLIVHHWAGTSGGDARLLNPSEQVSASYILYGSGELVGQVPEEFRPWTSGSWTADASAITVETQNSANGGEWPVSDAALEMLARLAADLCIRYGWGRLSRSRVRGHREFASTACPGPYLWARLDWIVQRGNQIIDQGEDDMFNDEDRALLRQTAQKANASYDALFKVTPTSLGTPAGVLRMTGAIYDSQFLERETSRGTPGGTLVNDRIMLAKLDAIIAHFDIPVELPEPGEDDAIASGE